MINFRLFVYNNTQTTPLHYVCEDYVVFSTVYLFLQYGADTRKVSDDDDAYSVAQTFENSWEKLDGHEQITHLLKSMEDVQNLLGKRKPGFDNRMDLFKLREFSQLHLQISMVEFIDSLKELPQLNQFLEVKRAKVTNTSNLFFGATLSVNATSSNSDENREGFTL